MRGEEVVRKVLAVVVPDGLGLFGGWGWPIWTV